MWKSSPSNFTIKKCSSLQKRQICYLMESDVYKLLLTFPITANRDYLSHSPLQGVGRGSVYGWKSIKAFSLFPARLKPYLYLTSNCIHKLHSHCLPNFHLFFSMQLHEPEVSKREWMLLGQQECNSSPFNYPDLFDHLNFSKIPTIAHDGENESPEIFQTKW